jgi:site-specific DNA-methyltransferase (adenine-specific)
VRNNSNIATVRPDLFGADTKVAEPKSAYDKTEQLGRLDTDNELREKLLPHCRLKTGEIWTDPKSGHRVGVIDATDSKSISHLMGDDKIDLALNDPPYNIKLANKSTDALFELSTPEYDSFSEKWVSNCVSFLNANASFYCWLGANYKNGFHPIPEFIVLMRKYNHLIPRNWITVRNQRGFGTQKNWMWIRQELLYYKKGDAYFDVNAEYTEIPKVLKGYYKTVNGKITENLERSKSNNIRAGNVWLDIQQVFYRLEENVPGCYAQKPLKSIERVIAASAAPGSNVVDFFAHSGTTLIAGEKAGRRVITCDIDPVYAELTIRRLERFRRLGKTGWQWENPFPEVSMAATLGDQESPDN